MSGRCSSRRAHRSSSASLRGDARLDNGCQRRRGLLLALKRHSSSVAAWAASPVGLYASLPAPSPTRISANSEPSGSPLAVAVQKKVQSRKTLTGWPDEASAQHPVGPTSPPGPRRTKLPWARQWGSTSGQLQGQLAALTAAASSQQKRFGRRPQLNQPSMRLEKHAMVRQSPRTRQSKRCPSQSTPLLASNHP